MFWDEENVKKIPIIESDDAFIRAMNYMVLCLTGYKAAVETILNRFPNVHIVSNIIKPLILDSAYKWSQTAILMLF